MVGRLGLQLRWLALSMYLGLELPIIYVVMKMEIGTVQRLTHGPVVYKWNYPPFLLFCTCVCAGMAGGDRAQERDCRFGDCQTQKTVKLSYSTALLLSWTVDCKYWPLALTLSLINLPDTLQSAMTTGQFCLAYAWQTHRQHTTNQPTHKQQHTNNTNNNTQPTHK